MIAITHELSQTDKLKSNSRNETEQTSCKLLEIEACVSCTLLRQADLLHQDYVIPYRGLGMVQLDTSCKSSLGNQSYL